MKSLFVFNDISTFLLKKKLFNFYTNIVCIILLNIYGHKVNFGSYLVFLIWLYDNKFDQFLSNGSCFLHTMIAYYVDYCKNELRFMPITILHLKPILLLMMKMTIKRYLLHFWRIRAGDRCTLNTTLCTYTFQSKTILHLQFE